MLHPSIFLDIKGSCSMTDLECKKICKVLDIKDIWLNVDNVVCVKTSTYTGYVYIYEDDFSSALPLRMLKLPSKGSSPKKNLLELLIRQSKDGIKSALVMPEPHGFCSHKTKLIDKNKSLESLLVQYDLKFSHKKKRACKKSRKSVE